MRRRRSGRLHLNAEINVVSLIDVMMLLLVIFMITAPLMQGGVDVKLPVASTRARSRTRAAWSSRSTSPAASIVDKTPMNYREFAAVFKTMAGKQAAHGVTVRADGRANVETLVARLAVIRNAGMTNIGIATEEAEPAAGPPR